MNRILYVRDLGNIDPGSPLNINTICGNTIMMLADLNAKEMEAIEKAGTLRTYGKEETVIAEGHGGSSFGLIISGKVQVQKNVVGIKEKKLAELGPCDVIGEIGFLGIPSRSASVIAVTECDILEFNRDQFEAFLEEHPALGVKIYRGMAKELARRLAQSDEKLLDTIVWAIGNKGDGSVTSQMMIPDRKNRLALKDRPPEQ